MPWFKLDDGFANHPKVMQAGNAATGLWVRCGTYSSQYLLDGHVPAEVARDFGTTREITALERVGLWVACDDFDGYLIHDYLDYNPTKEQVITERAAARKRMADRRTGSP